MESRELKLLDEMLIGKTPRNIYEKLEKQYQKKIGESQARLSQVEVDYDDPLDFFDKCIVIASMLLQLHQRFNYDQRKDLLKAVFERIYIKDKAITGVKMNPPFSFFFGEPLEKLFKDCPDAPTKQDIFEQVVKFTLSESYPLIKERINKLVKLMDI